MTAWTFHTFMSLNIENGDLGTEMGTQKLNKVPMGTRSLKWGPMWPQCKHNVWPGWTVSRVISSAKQHRWLSVMRRPRVCNWWQKIPGSRSKGVKYTWIEAWSLADKILLEALHFLQITWHIMTEHRKLWIHISLLFTTYSISSPGDVHVDIFSSFILHGAGWVWLLWKKIWSNIGQDNSTHRLAKV